MKITFKKIRHLYLFYGILNAVLIISITISISYLYSKQAWLSTFEQKLNNELINLSELKASSKNFAKGEKFEDDFYKEGVDNQQIELIKQINSSKQILNELHQTYYINNLHFNENIKALLSDYDILISQNELLFDYIRKIGNSNNGVLLNLKNAHQDFEQKLNTYPSNQTINEDLKQSMFLINLLVRNKDELLITEIEKRMDRIKSVVSLPDTTSGDYRMLRLSDSFQNLEYIYLDLAKTILEIGIAHQSGLIFIMEDRYQKANFRLHESLRIIKQENNSIQTNTFITLSGLFLLVVILNFVSALYFIQYSRNFAEAFEDHLDALQSGEFIKIRRNKIPHEAFDLVDAMENFSIKFINSGKYIASISAGNNITEKNKTDHLEWLFPFMNKVRQNIEDLNAQLKTERTRQSKMQWIKNGTEKLTEVMRQEFDSPLLHSNKIIFALIQYLDIPMGAIYHVKEENGTKLIEMAASFAYGKEKQLYKKIAFGEGMIGTAASERKTLNLTNIPDGYFNIVSGFSESKPKNIIVCPIMLNDEIFGVIELASLLRFKDEEILFVEEVCKSIAYSFAISKVYMDTLNLFEGANLEISHYKSENEALLIDNDALNLKFKNLKELGADNENIVEKLNEFAIMIYLDLDGNILEVNSRFEQFFKAEKKKFLHSNYREYMIESDNDFDFENTWRELRAGYQHEFNQKVIVANEEFWLNQHYFPMKDQKGRVKGIKIMAFDITDKLKVENHSIT